MANSNVYKDVILDLKRQRDEFEEKITELTERRNQLGELISRLEVFPGADVPTPAATTKSPRATKKEVSAPKKAVQKSKPKPRQRSKAKATKNFTDTVVEIVRHAEGEVRTKEVISSLQKINAISEGENNNALYAKVYTALKRRSEGDQPLVRQVGRGVWQGVAA